MPTSGTGASISRTSGTGCGSNRRHRGPHEPVLAPTVASGRLPDQVRRVLRPQSLLDAGDPPCGRLRAGEKRRGIDLTSGSSVAASAGLVLLIVSALLIATVEPGSTMSEFGETAALL